MVVLSGCGVMVENVLKNFVDCSIWVKDVVVDECVVGVVG